jgi:hypothetical protein
VIISGDRRSNRPEVFDAYTDRGAQVLNTSRAGAVSATISQAGVRVRNVNCRHPKRLNLTMWMTCVGSPD